MKPTLTALRLAFKAKPAADPIPEEPVKDPDPVEDIKAAPTKKYVKKTKKKEEK